MNHSDKTKWQQIRFESTGSNGTRQDLKTIKQTETQIAPIFNKKKEKETQSNYESVL